MNQVLKKVAERVEARLVPDWREAWKWDSVRVFALLAALPVAWEQVPVEVKAMVPAEANPWLLAGIAVLGAIGRLRKQL